MARNPYFVKNLLGKNNRRHHKERCRKGVLPHDEVNQRSSKRPGEKNVAKSSARALRNPPPARALSSKAHHRRLSLNINQRCPRFWSSGPSINLELTTFDDPPWIKFGCVCVLHSAAVYGFCGVGRKGSRPRKEEFNRGRELMTHKFPKDPRGVNGLFSREITKKRNPRAHGCTRQMAAF